MYKLAKSEKFSHRGEIITPLLTLKNQFGGIAHIDKVNDSYVLYVKSQDGHFVISPYWFMEAIAFTSKHLSVPLTVPIPTTKKSIKKKE